MATFGKTIGFTPTDYAAEQGEIERRKQYAQALQAQGMQPMGDTQMAGGWAIKNSPLQGLAKMLQAYGGRKGMEEAAEQEKALGQRYQSDLARTLMEAQRAGMGSPAQTIQPDPQEAQQAADFGTPQVGPVHQPAVAPDRQAMARILMGHPGTQPLGLAETQRDMQMQSFLGMAGAQGQPQGQPSAMPASAQQMPGFGGPAGGIPMAVWLQADPTGSKYLAALAQQNQVQGGVSYDQQGRAFVVNKAGSIQYLPGITARDKKEMVDTGSGIQPVNPYTQTEPIPKGLTPAEQVRLPLEQGKYRFETGQQPPPMPGQQQQAPQAQAGPEPLPPGVPESDRAAYEHVLNASRAGQFASAKGLTPGLTPKQQAEIDAKRAAEAPQARQQIDLQLQDLDRLTNVAKEIANHPGLGRATGIVGAFPSIPGQPAANTEALITSLKAQISAMKLQAMRNASKTGGAVGQVTEREWPRLENMIVAFDPVKMGKEASQAKLIELVQEIDKVKQSINEAYAAEYGGGMQNNDPLGLR